MSLYERLDFTRPNRRKFKSVPESKQPICHDERVHAAKAFVLRLAPTRGRSSNLNVRFVVV